ncbi:hypothetical protein BTJ49_04045 [Oleiagrimonas sp. MCCC 1A03011]|nr:hypothetical protein BTJ49_04045 [Oleiagrimonas sp. MCCC 1A03011]
MRGVVAMLLLFAVHPLLAAGRPAVQARVLMSVLPASAWQKVSRAEGVRTGGTASDPVEIQVIVDVNCPYCARLYRMFRRGHPGVAVRWVPIDYLLKDSGRVAAAILQSPDPVASLDTNFLHYHNDYKDSHGGYLPPAGKHFALPRANVELAQDWARWGGSTPMILFRDDRGRILRASGARRDVVDQVLMHVRSSLPAYGE